MVGAINSVSRLRAPRVARITTCCDRICPRRSLNRKGSPELRIVCYSLRRRLLLKRLRQSHQSLQLLQLIQYELPASHQQPRGSLRHLHADYSLLPSPESSLVSLRYVAWYWESSSIILSGPGSKVAARLLKHPYNLWRTRLTVSFNIRSRVRPWAIPHITLRTLRAQLLANLRFPQMHWARASYLPVALTVMCQVLSNRILMPYTSSPTILDPERISQQYLNDLVVLFQLLSYSSVKDHTSCSVLSLSGHMMLYQA